MTIAPQPPSAGPSPDKSAENGRPLHIGVDIRRAGGFGVGIYTKNLVQSLARVGPQHRYVLVGGRENFRHLGDLGPNFRLELYERRYDSLRSHWEYGFLLRRLGLDVFHMPHRWVPLTTPAPYVATLHDLNYVLFPPDEGSKMVDRARLWALTRGLARAAKIIAVSQATKRDAVTHLNLPEEKFRVIYDAVDENIAQPVTDDQRRETLQRYSINEPFLLYAGRIQIHKNVPRLIEAFAYLKAQLENHWKYHNLKLIVIGDDINRFPSVRHAMMRSRTQDSIRFLGFVPLETLRVFYDQATAFVFPSLYEGFGMPPLEAMVHGTPVVTSAASSLPEAVGEAAELVNPENVFDIARGMRKVLLDDDYRAELRRRGFEQVRRFSWDRSAREVLEVYRSIALSRA
ncbi:MAG: glycosyltransferase family 4 protein [Acidobacteria bacterium]|nr:glycosyltransferase family 4 protein [Acidobacteriota bacterium]